MEKNALKLKAMGLISDGIPLREITDQLNVPYPKLLRWRKELNKAIEEKTLVDLIKVDETVVHEVAAQIAEDLIALDPTQSEAIEGELLDVTKGVDGYQKLSVELQTVASKLAKKISHQADQSPGPMELESLVASLAKLQEAFFNKNMTQIAVFGGDSGSNTSVSKFKSLQKA